MPGKRIPPTNGAPRAPTPEDFSAGAIQKAVLKESATHPMVVYPLAAGTVLGWLPLLILGLHTLPVAVPLTLFGVGAGIVNFFFRDRTIAANYIERLRKERTEYQEHHVAELTRIIQDSGFDEGDVALQELRRVYEALRMYLEEQRDGISSARVTRFATLADDTYQQGIQILQRAQELHRVLGEVDKESTERELTSNERELAKLKRIQHPNANTQIQIQRIETSIQGLGQSIQLYTQREESLVGLLHEAVRLSGLLERTYLELVDLVSKPEEATEGGASNELETALRAARTIETRLRDEHPEDQTYLEAGRNRER